MMYEGTMTLKEFRAWVRQHSPATIELPRRAYIQYENILHRAAWDRFGNRLGRVDYPLTFEGIAVTRV